MSVIAMLPFLRAFGRLLGVAPPQLQSFVTIIPRQGDFSRRLAYMARKTDSMNTKEKTRCLTKK